MVGVPDSVPSAESERPAGRLPATTEKSPTGVPRSEVNEDEYAMPVTPSGGAGPGAAGAAPSSPSLLSPQQPGVPSVLIAHVCHWPAVIAVSVPVPAGTVAWP